MKLIGLILFYALLVASSKGRRRPPGGEEADRLDLRGKGRVEAPRQPQGELSPRMGAASNPLAPGRGQVDGPGGLDSSRAGKDLIAPTSGAPDRHNSPRRAWRSAFPPG